LLIEGQRVLYEKRRGSLCIIIIIIIHHELRFIDLFRPLPLVSSNIFQVVFVRLVSNSSLFLSSCCCSFLLHVAANLICIFLVSRQLVLLSALTKFPHYFCVTKWCNWLFFWKISSWSMPIVFLSFFLRVQISLQNRWMGRASVLYSFILENILVRVGLKVIFKNSKHLSKVCYFLLNIFSIFVENFTTEIFKILYLLETFVIHDYCTSDWVLSWKRHRLRFFWWEFHS
jgi:hypothetical protein